MNLIESIRKILNNLYITEEYNISTYKTTFKSCTNWNIHFTVNNKTYNIEIYSDSELDKHIIRLKYVCNEKFSLGSIVEYDIPESDRSEIYYLADTVHRKCKDYTEHQYFNIF